MTRKPYICEMCNERFKSKWRACWHIFTTNQAAHFAWGVGAGDDRRKLEKEFGE